jgi:hypothetical protein
LQIVLLSWIAKSFAIQDSKQFCFPGQQFLIFFAILDSKSCKNRKLFCIPRYQSFAIQESKNCQKIAILDSKPFCFPR